MSVRPILTGVDLVDINRLMRMIEDSGPEFIQSAWTTGELHYCKLNPERLAARWAAKEATMKALGDGIGTFSPLDIEVHNNNAGTPILQLHGTAGARAEELKVVYWSLTLSHEAGFAVAFVVALAGGNNNV